ncbi:sodium/potassium-transporting ATPase subunit beta-2-like, partial [Neopelma chrysocephalum]|uniref:sodium/potassium-transporting ATPase subunit beta-2-like n=1 Tax=Neopelma chrysocephalum TaxID=114329 RepID=UPI000FCD30A8
ARRTPPSWAPSSSSPPNGSIDLMYFPYYGKRVHVSDTPDTPRDPRGGPETPQHPGSPQREEDAALLGPLQLFPPNGSIDLMYFPYYGKRVHVNYTQPVVAVQFPNATANVDHHVECRLNAAGLRTDDERDKFAGRVAFRLRINRD